jgi:uncharacterized membrane protein
MNKFVSDQDDWCKDENWGGPKYGEVYFCKKDPRIIVPKRIRWMGWTVNLAHKSGVLLFVGALFGTPSFVFLFLFLVGAN